MKMNFYLFNNFETLDLFGPVEIFCRVPDLEPEYYSFKGGVIESAQKTKIITKPINECEDGSIFLIPGGRGTRSLVKDKEELSAIKNVCENAKWCLSVCTGSAVLAACGLLDGKVATSNKKAFEWVRSCSANVCWEKIPRFCKDGKFYTSAGVSAGIDMALEFVKDNYGNELVEAIVDDIEY